MDEYPHEFSGGMRQRAMIAMALVNDPKILIADEPTTALDVTIQAQILALIERLQDQLGMAVILITHDLGVIAEVADEVERDVRRAHRRGGDAGPDLLRPAAPLHLGAPGLARQARPAPRRTGSPRSAGSLRRCWRRRRAATSAPAARTPSSAAPRCRRSRYAAGEAGHADRCWLSAEQKRALRVVERPNRPRGAGGVNEAAPSTPDAGHGARRTERCSRCATSSSTSRSRSGSSSTARSAGCAPWTGSASTSPRARRWGWSASPAAGSPPCAARSSSCSSRPRARCASRAARSSGCGRRELQPLRREMQMIFQDPYASLNPRKRVGQTSSATRCASTGSPPARS